MSEIDAPSVDVIVIGGGIAGLAAASELEGAGLNFVVLEASDRVGGRILSHKMPSGVRVDVGAAWVAPFHLEMLKLCALFDVPLARSSLSPNELPEIICIGDARLGAAKRAALQRDIEAAIDVCVNEAASARPSDDLKNVDALDWLEAKGIGPDAISVFSDLPRSAQSAWALVNLTRAGGENFFAPDRWCFAPRGLDSLTTRMAARFGSRVWLGALVEDVEQGRRTIVRCVHEGSVREISALRVIAAIPPAAVAEVKGIHMKSHSVGRLTRNREIVVELDGRDCAVSRAALTDGLPRIVVRQDCESGRSIARITVVEGSAGWSDEVDSIARRGIALISDAPAHVREIAEGPWWRARSGGTYGAFAPGAGRQTSDLYLQDGSVLMAGDLVIPSFAGYAEGGVRSGIAAARRVLEDLQTEPAS